MSSRDERLEALLAGIAGEAGRAAEGPELSRRRGIAVTRAEVLARHDEREDPLTGHRGVAEGVHLLVRAGVWLVDLQLRDEKSGIVLRGQVLPVSDATPAPAGALVHARAGGEAFLACVDAAGEFVLRGLPVAALDGLLLELEDGVHELPWPGEPAP